MNGVCELYFATADHHMMSYLRVHGWLVFRDRSLFITWGGRRILGGDHLIFRRTEGGSVVTESPKGGDH